MLKFECYNKGQGIDFGELEGYLKKHQNVLEIAQKQDKRYEDNLGWKDPDIWAGEKALSKIEKIAERIRKEGDALVLVGVGGSNNAARAVIKALKKRGMPEVYYAGNNISSYSANCLLKKLEGKSVYVNMIAKNFETLEPGIGFRIFRRYLEERYGTEASMRITVTGTRGSYLENLCRKQGYTFLFFPEDIGGRYSALCDVGLLPMAVAGLNIRKMVQGAKDMRNLLISTSVMDNPAFSYAAVRNLMYQKGYRMEILSFFEPQLKYFSKWWIQLLAESEGKEGKGVYPIAAEYSEDLHSIGQFIQEGSPIIYETFLNVEEQEESYIIQDDSVDDRFGYLDGKDLRDINKTAYQATCKAHAEYIPVTNLTVERLDEYYFGQLFYFFEFACYISGMLLGVNPFNQPGVEAYKRYMFEALHKE